MPDFILPVPFDGKYVLNTCWHLFSSLLFVQLFIYITEPISNKTVKLIVAGTHGLFSVDVLYYNTSTVIGHRISHMTGTSQLLLAREADAVVYDPITDSVIFHDVISRTIRSMPFKGE